MKLWPFSSQNILSDERQVWLRSNLDWLISQFGALTDFENRSLVLPTPSSFKTGGKQGHDLAIHVMEQVKHYAGMSDFKIRLIQVEHSHPEYVGNNPIKPVHNEGTPAGTYRVNKKGEAEITYDTKLLKHPIKLISTLAHELAHDLMSFSREPLPEDELEMELQNDLAAVFMGYGVFMANTAFEYQQFDDGNLAGWSYSRLGYLPENEIVFATALFIKMKNFDVTETSKHLKPGLATTLRKCLAIL